MKKLLLLLFPVVALGQPINPIISGGSGSGGPGGTATNIAVQAAGAASIITNAPGNFTVNVPFSVIGGTTVSNALVAATATTATTATYATNSPTGQPLAWTSGTNAIASFAAQSSLITHGASVGRYGAQFTNTAPIVITEVARWVGIENSNTHPVEVTTAFGRVLGVAPVVSARYATNGWAWVPLDKPVFIPGNGRFNVVAHETTDWLYQNSAPTFSAGGVVSLVGGVAENTWPKFDHGWTNVSFRVNFRYYQTATDQSHDSFLQIAADSIAGGLQDAHSGPAVMDLAAIQTDDWKVPQLGIAMYTHDYDANVLPNQSNVWAYANAMRTNGMMAAGWNNVAPDDFWFLAVHSTNTSLVFTQVSQFYWAANAGGRAGADVVPVLVPRDSDQLSYVNTNTFPGGISNLNFVVKTNRAGDFSGHIGWYLNQRTNTVQLSNEVFRATRWGLPSMFVDNTVSEDWYGTNNIGPTTRRIIRTFQEATLAGAEAGNAGPFTNATHGMLLYAGGQANDTHGGNAAESTWAGGDFISGINGYFFSGADVNSLASTVAKVDVMMVRSRFYRLGHFPHFQFMKWDNSQSAEFYRRKLAAVMLLPASINTGPDAAFRAGADMWVLTNQYPFVSILKDKAGLPGRWTYTNGLFRIGARQLKAKDSGTNYVVVMNLSDTNFTGFLNVTNFGGSSNVTYTAEAVWDYGSGARTNFTFVNEISRTVSPTNVEAFTIYAPSSSGDVTQAGQNNFSGSNYFAGPLTSVTNYVTLIRANEPSLEISVGDDSSSIRLGGSSGVTTIRGDTTVTGSLTANSTITGDGSALTNFTATNVSAAWTGAGVYMTRFGTNADVSSIGGGITNAVSTIEVNGVEITNAATTLNFIEGTNTTITSSNYGSGVISLAIASLLLDLDNDGGLPGVLDPHEGGFSIGTNLSSLAGLASNNVFTASNYFSQGPVVSASSGAGTYLTRFGTNADAGDVTLAQLQSATNSAGAITAGALFLGTNSVNSWDDVTNFFAIPASSSGGGWWVTNAGVAAPNSWTNYSGGSNVLSAGNVTFYPGPNANTYINTQDGQVSRLGGALEFDAGNTYFIGDHDGSTSAGDFNLNDGTVNSINVTTAMNVTGDVTANAVQMTGATNYFLWADGDGFLRPTNNGAGLTNLTGANVSGTVANATAAVNATNIYGAGLTSMTNAAAGLLSLDNTWTGSNIFNGGLSGSGAGLTGIPLSALTTNGLTAPTAGQVVTMKADGSMTLSNAASGSTPWQMDLINGEIVSWQWDGATTKYWRMLPGIQSGAAFYSSSLSGAVGIGPKGGYLSNLVIYASVQLGGTTNVTYTVCTNALGADAVASLLQVTLDSSSQITNSGTLSVSLPSGTNANLMLGIGLNSYVSAFTTSHRYSVEWWHQ